MLCGQNLPVLVNVLSLCKLGPKVLPGFSHTESIAKLPMLLRKVLPVIKLAGGTYC